jgi:L-xylulokinase
MFADVLAMPIEIPDAQESGARGAALVAGVGIGAYPDIDAAMDRATREARGYVPNEAHVDLYAQRFETYRGLIDAMAPAWRSFASAP